MSRAPWVVVAMLASCAIAQAQVEVIPAPWVRGGGTARGPIQRTDGTATAPSDTYASDRDLGRYRIGADNEGFTAGGTLRWDYNTTRVNTTIPIYLALGTAEAPSLSTPNDTDTGLFFPFANYVGISAGTSNVAAFQGNGLEIINGANVIWVASIGSGADVSLGRGAANRLDLASGDSFNLVSGTLRLNDVLLVSTTAPTISSGFGTTPSIANNNGTAAFTINVGTGGTASSGVVGLPTATTGWSCEAQDQTTPGVNATKQTANTTASVTLTNYNTTTGVAAAWTASDILYVNCLAF